MRKNIEELNFVANDFDGTMHGSLTNILFNIKYKLNEIIDVLNSKDDCVEKPEDWEKSFDEKFRPQGIYNDADEEEIKSFIHNLLQSREDEIYKELEAWAGKIRNIHALLAEQWTGIELGKATRHTINPHQEKVEILDEFLSHLSTKRKK